MNNNILTKNYIMKKIIISLTVAMTLIAGTSWALNAASNSNHSSFLENAEALGEIVNASDADCFIQYEWNFWHRCLVCIQCEFVWGKGETIGGKCGPDSGEEEDE